jgi:hypothetical protein
VNESIFFQLKEHELYKNFTLLNSIEKKLKAGGYSNHQDLATDIRSILNKYFTMHVNEPEIYSQICLLSDSFENIYKQYENKIFSKESKNILDLKRKMTILKREIKERSNPNLTQIKPTKLRIDINEFNIQSEKDKKISKKYKLTLVNNIKSLNSDQIKGIINIIYDNLNTDEKTMEFDINKLSFNKVRELDKYVKKCLKQNTKSCLTKEKDKVIAIMPSVPDLKLGTVPVSSGLITTGDTVSNDENFLLRKRSSILSDIDSLSSDDDSGKIFIIIDSASLSSLSK